MYLQNKRKQTYIFIDEIQNLVIGYNFCRGSTNKVRFGGMG